MLLITFVPEFKFRFLFGDQALKSEKERALAIAILKFPDALDSLVQVSPPAMRHIRALNLKSCVLQELLPSRLCDYAYYLCVTFNEFYSSCKVGISKDLCQGAEKCVRIVSLLQVIGSDEEKTRLVLCQGTALSLRKAMYILGIEPLNKL